MMKTAVKNRIATTACSILMLFIVFTVLAGCSSEKTDTAAQADSMDADSVKKADIDALFDTVLAGYPCRR